MSFKEFIAILYCDLSQYSKKIFSLSFLNLFIFKPIIQVVCLFRLIQYISSGFKIPILKQLILCLCKILYNISIVIAGIDITTSSKIGKGLFIPHSYGIVIHEHTEIGEFCIINQGVTIGKGGVKTKGGVPKIGNTVMIGAGAKLIGGITVGNNVSIGANAVVTKSIPDNAVVVGIPAKVIHYKEMS